MNRLIEIFCTLLVLLPIFILALEFASYMEVGGYVKSKDVIKAIEFHLPKGAHLNPFDNDIITIGDMPFIATSKSLLGMYYIHNVGRIWLFSPAHKRISEIHKQLLAEKQNQTIDEMLNIK